MPKVKHRQSRRDRITAEYRAWIEMRRRANDRGQRGNTTYIGIFVDPEWDRSSEAFYRDVGPRPSPEHSLDRYPDNAGDYRPGNVRWATREEQSRNKRTNVFVVIGGESRCLTDWARLAGLSAPMVWRRHDAGWPPERLLIPPQHEGYKLIKQGKARLTKISAQQ